MKRSFYSVVVILFCFVGVAMGNPFLLVSGSPNPPTLPYSNISNGEAASYPKGTEFNNVPVGGALRHKIRLQNLGPSILNYSVSDNSSQFQAIGPGSVLVPTTGVREFEIEFAPTSIGTKTAVLTITSNDPNRPTYQVNLRGVGVAPELDVFGGPSLNVAISSGDYSPQAADGTEFGYRDLGDGAISKFFRLKNNGSSDLQFIGASITPGQGFSISSLPSPASFIGSGEQHSFIISFDPSTLGSKTARVTVLTNDANEGTYTFDVHGTGTTTPDIAMKGRSGALPLTAITNGSINFQAINGTSFGNTDVNGVTRNLFEISNEGTAALDFSITVNNPEFEILSVNVSSLPTGINNSELFFIDFKPTSRGVKTATVRIDSNDPDEDPFKFLIQGTGVGPEITLLGDTDFSEVIENGDTTPRVGDGTNFLDVLVRGVTERRTFRIKNDGDAILTFMGGSITPSLGFFISGLPSINFPIPPKGYVEFEVAFDPNTDGQRTATVEILTTDQDESPYRFDVTANGVGDPDIRINGNYMSFQDSGDYIAPGTLIASNALGTQFGEVDLGGTKSKAFLIDNVGQGTLDYTASVTGSDFRINDIGSTLEPNQGTNSERRFTMTFEPTTRGTKTAIVTVTSNDPDTGSYVFVVEGKATDPEMDLFGGPALNVPVVDGSLTADSRNGTAFDPQTVGSAGLTHTFYIYNSGERNLVIAGGALDDETHFTMTGLPTSIQPIGPSSSAEFQISFEPQSAGRKATTVNIFSNDDDENPYTFQIGGTGLDGPEFNLRGGFPRVDIMNGDTTPDVADDTSFGAYNVGESETHFFVIANDGNRDLTIFNSAISPGQGFTLGPISSSPIAPQGETTFSVTFAPGSAGARSAVVTLISNDSDKSPYTFVVNGEGVMNASAPDLEIWNGTGTSVLIPSGSTTTSEANGTDFGTVEVGENLRGLFLIRNTGGLNLVNVSMTGATSVGLASTVLPGGEDAFAIELPTSTPGVITATVSFASNDPDENPYTFVVTGTVLAPAETPRISSMVFNGSTGVFTFPTSLGRRYQITFTDTMVGAWVPYVQGGIVEGTGEDESIEVLGAIVPGQDRMFFRVELVNP